MNNSLDSLLRASSFAYEDSTSQPHASTSALPEEEEDEEEGSEDDLEPKKRGRRVGKSDKRKQQNRIAQKSFRVRKDQRLRELEEQVREITRTYEEGFEILETLQAENGQLRQARGENISDQLADILQGTSLEPVYASIHQRRVEAAVASPAVSTRPLPFVGEEEGVSSEPVSRPSTSSSAASGTAKRVRRSKYDLVPNPTGSASTITASPSVAAPALSVSVPTSRISSPVFVQPMLGQNVTSTNHRILQSWMTGLHAQGQPHSPASQQSSSASPSTASSAASSNFSGNGRFDAGH